MKRTFWRSFPIGFVCLAASAGVVPDRYIVELSSPPVAGRLAAQGRPTDRLEVERQRADVRSEQAATKLAIELAGGQVLDSVDIVTNAIFVRMRASEAAALTNLPGVKHVFPVRQFRPVMDHAVVVHKIVDAWNIVGLANAGAGIKIAIIDTGVENTHAAFQAPSLTPPQGYPQVDNDADRPFTNSKVIVARSYVYLLAPDPDQTARDHVGHGTSVAMAAAGVLNAGPLATIRGVAPVAFLGNYKVFGSPGVNDFAGEDAVLKAIDDAVSDGMDVINLSLSDPVPIVLGEDLEVAAIEQATAMGHIVVVAAGNSGPDPQTIGSPSSAPAAITAGAAVNNRTFTTEATVGGVSYQSLPGSGPTPAQPVTAPIVDITTLGDNGLACSALPANSLKGDIALMLRGTCLFSDKLANAQAAGAIGALVYTDQTQPQAIVMDVGSVTLPAMMVSYTDGLSVKNQLANQAKEPATLDFTERAFFVDPEQLASFSSAGPNVDGSIKPDLVAVGQYVYTAAETFDPKGELYSANGYVFVDGTSYSSPIVAGSVALVEAARPGLTVAQYRSLLIHSAAPAFVTPGVPARLQQSGAGLLDVNAALRASGAIAPTELSFGVGNGTLQLATGVTVTNVSHAPETFTTFVAERDAPSGPIPPGSRTAAALDTYDALPVVTVTPSTLTLAPGTSGLLSVSITGFDLPPGAYEGFLHVLGTNSGVDERVPYWYGVGSTVPAHLTILNMATTPAAGSTVPDAAQFRVTDANGITVPGVTPTASVIDGGGSILGIVDHSATNPGVFGLDVQLGPAAGSNDFQIRVGNLTQTVTIISQ
jgi:minor extracellular serine protease Vpr